MPAPPGKQAPIDNLPVFVMLLTNEKFSSVEEWDYSYVNQRKPRRSLA
jgi:hypothetical protein